MNIYLELLLGWVKYNKRRFISIVFFFDSVCFIINKKI